MGVAAKRERRVLTTMVVLVVEDGMQEEVDMVRAESAS